MRIDPKTFTLDALERSVLDKALTSYKVHLAGKLAYHKRRESLGYTDKVRENVSRIEMEQARVCQLIEDLAK